jgi:hypothetical protein
MSSNVPALSHGVTHLENAIVTLSGPALATSGIIAGVDILTNNLIARYAPGAGAIAGLVWAICLMLTLDFQVLMLGVRARRIYGAPKKGSGQKFGELLLCVVIAAALGYVSLQMGSIFAHMLGTNLTIIQAQADLGINPIALIYERSALVLVLIFLSGWLREHDTVRADPPVTPQPPAPITPPVDELLDKLDARYHERMALQLEALYQRTLETVKISIAEATNPMLPALPAPENGMVDAPTRDEETSSQQPLSISAFASKEQDVARVLQERPGATVEEVSALAGCSTRTAEKWIKRLAKEQAS